MRILFLAPQPFSQQRGTPLAERAVLEVLGARGYEIALLTEPTPAALGEGLRRLLSDPGLRHSLGSRARERVRREHTLEAFWRKVGAFYDDVEERLGRKRPVRLAIPMERLVPER